MRRKLLTVCTMFWEDFLGMVPDLVLNTIAASSFTPRIIRWLIYNAYGIKAEAISIYPGCYIKTKKLRVGGGTFINRGCFFDNVSEVVLEENCSVGMEVMFCTSTHHVGSEEKRASSQTIGLPIRVGKGTWIGTRAVILPGVTIGNGCIIAAGSVVTKDCGENGLYAGAPAKRVKDLSVTNGADPLSKEINAVHLKRGSLSIAENNVGNSAISLRNSSGS
ncbi:acyltransferase [Brevibacillus centrosporus]|nr:acyltransferase [Brevibacillus centrosporus]